MAEFRRGLTDDCTAALQKLAKTPGGNWWTEVLNSKNLLLGVRGGYLNAYVNGQSIFRIIFEDGTGADGMQVHAKTHYKFLVKPTVEMEDTYVRFDGATFEIDPNDVVGTRYEPKKTLSSMISAASRYAGKEKKGIQKIAQNEPKVVDLEIAFTRSGDDEGKKATAPRMDLAVLIPGGREGAHLVFCEAKCADNAELRMLAKDKSATGETPIAVVAQIRKYEAFIRKNQAALVPAYRSVCQTLTDLHQQGWQRKLDDLVRAVAQGMTLSIHPNVYLLVYGFDDDQKKTVKRKLDALDKGGLPRSRIIEKGNPDAFRLEKDIERARRRSNRAG